MVSTRVDPTFRVSQLRWPRAQNAALLQPEGTTFRYVFHARYAIYQALVAMRREGKSAVLVPAYNCPVVNEAVLQAGLEPRYYDLTDDLSPDPLDIARKSGADVAAIVVVDFFGFSADMGAVPTKLRDEAYVIEDCSHSFLHVAPLRLAGRRGDVTNYSFWKIVPCLVGGGLAIDVELQMPPRARFLALRESARVSKRLVEQAGEASGWSGLTAFMARVRARRSTSTEPATAARSPLNAASVAPAVGASGTGDYGSYTLHPSLRLGPMPWLSKRILDAVDLAEIAERRRRNYRIYLDGLRNDNRLRMVFPLLPDHVVPWVFPILVEGRDRDHADYRLRDQGVLLHTFGNTLHPTVAQLAEPATLRKALYWADNIVCLSVHQDLTGQDIAESCEKINRFMRC